MNTMTKLTIALILAMVVNGCVQRTLVAPPPKPAAQAPQVDNPLRNFRMDDSGGSTAFDPSWFKSKTDPKNGHVIAQYSVIYEQGDMSGGILYFADCDTGDYAVGHSFARNTVTGKETKNPIPEGKTGHAVGEPSIYFSQYHYACELAKKTQMTNPSSDFVGTGSHSH